MPPMPPMPPHEDASPEELRAALEGIHLRLAEGDDDTHDDVAGAALPASITGLRMPWRRLRRIALWEEKQRRKGEWGERAAAFSVVRGMADFLTGSWLGATLGVVACLAPMVAIFWFLLDRLPQLDLVTRVLALSMAIGVTLLLSLVGSKIVEEYVERRRASHITGGVMMAFPSQSLMAAPVRNLVAPSPSPRLPLALGLARAAAFLLPVVGVGLLMANLHWGPGPTGPSTTLAEHPGEEQGSTELASRSEDSEEPLVVAMEEDPAQESTVDELPRELVADLQALTEPLDAELAEPDMEETVEEVTIVPMEIAMVEPLGVEPVSRRAFLGYSGDSSPTGMDRLASGRFLSEPLGLETGELGSTMMFRAESSWRADEAEVDRMLEQMAKRRSFHRASDLFDIDKVDPTTIPDELLRETLDQRMVEVGAGTSYSSCFLAAVDPRADEGDLIGRVALKGLLVSMAAADEKIEFEKPSLENQAKKVYPRKARRLGKAGTVRFRVCVDGEGKPVRIEQEGEKLGYGLDEAARAMVEGSSWKPAHLGGLSAPGWAELSVAFEPPGHSM